MSFGSPGKIFSPNNTNPNSVKPQFSNFVPNMTQPNPQMQLKPGMALMSYMINFVVLKTYTDFHQLVDLLPSRDDVEKKIDIANFLNRTRHLLIRLQALNKWTPSAQKVDKCEKISNLLDDQSSFLMKTAEELSILAQERLPFARLNNFLPIIAADVFVSKTYSRLPNVIKLSVSRNERINSIDKIRMFDELDRILRIRLSNSKIPYRMRRIDISNGRVTFTVPNEFVVTCTLMSDHFDHPWRVLNVGFLVRGNGVCRGRSLVHANHLRSIHEVVQLRLNNSHFDQRPSLYHLYDMMHAMSVFLQLEVLHEQICEYRRHGQGATVSDVKYVRGQKLEFSYWKRSTEKYLGRPKHTVTICVDEEDGRRPLRVRHLPALCCDDSRTERLLDTANLSIKNLISESITARIFSTLKMIQRLLFPFNDSNCVATPNPVLLIQILTTDNKENNFIKIQIQPSSGYARTSFKMPIDFITGSQENKITKILFDLDTDINELLLKTFSSNEIFDAKKIISSSENRDLLNHRKNIANSMNKLRIILTKYECLSVLQKVGFKDLSLYLNKPPICREKSMEKVNRNPIYDLLELEAKNECELLFIPINYEWNYFIVVVCETKFRMVPNYRIFVLSTTKVFTVAATAPYSEKVWTLRPVKLSPVPTEIIRKISNIKNDKFKVNEMKNNLKRESMTCSDLLHKIQSKKIKLNNGMSVVNGNTDEEYSGQLIVHALPDIIDYLKANIIFKLLLHEIERRSIYFESERINEEIFVHSCKIKNFPSVKGCSKRATSLMNKMLMYCSVTYVSRPEEVDGTTQIKWEAELFMRSPFILLDKSISTLEPYSKKIVLCSKKCLEENRTGIKEAVEKLLSFWEEICHFGDCFLLPLFDKGNSIGSEFKLVEYRFNELVFTYGNDHQYKVVVSYSISSGFTVCPDISDTHIHRITLTNPHVLIKKDLENYMNSHKNIVALIKMLSDTLEFLTIIYPFSNSTLMVMQDCNSTQLLKNYSLIILDAYHVVLVFRERFALNIILNNETQTVQLSDAHKNFHACNMSIKEMPLFDKFMWSLEEVYRMNIEDEVWSGLFVDQLAALLGSHNMDNRSGPTILENYLLSALQLGAREEMLCLLPCGNEARMNSGAELQIELVSREDKSIPFWELQMKMKQNDSNISERPWLLENDMFTLAKNIFETKIRAPKQSESGLNMFKRLLQLPSFQLQHNLLKILNQSPITFELDSKKCVSFIDIDWANFHEAISQTQEPSSIVLRFVVNIKISKPKIDKWDKTINLPIVLHYAARSNQIAVLNGTHSAIQRHNFDTDANNSVIGIINGDTPLLSFVNKLFSNIKDCI